MSFNLLPLDPSAALIVAYLDGLQVKVNALRELQSASGEELRPFFGRTLTLSPSPSTSSG